MSRGSEKARTMAFVTLSRPGSDRRLRCRDDSRRREGRYPPEAPAQSPSAHVAEPALLELRRVSPGKGESGEDDPSTRFQDACDLIDRPAAARAIVDVVNCEARDD